MIWGMRYNEKRNYIWFAWYPIKLINGQWIWLEKVKAQKLYRGFRQFYRIKELENDK